MAGGLSTNTVSKLGDFQSKLEQAWQQKRDKDFISAERSFISLLESEAPAELHRTALLELAVLAQESHQLPKAQQIFAQYLKTYPDDPNAPEVLLRQGLIYREMGAYVMSLSKFYAVMTAALRLNLDRLQYYQRVVLQAQTEIADTYYAQGKYEDAAEFLGRLLRLNDQNLNKRHILYKLIQSLSYVGRDADSVIQAQSYVTHYPDGTELPEVRFLLADALKKLGRNRESLREVLLLLESQQAQSPQNSERWLYWQQRTGNEIANQLYKEGDYVNALEIYKSLANLNNAPSWKLPVWYQIGLVYERLQQLDRAIQTYDRILNAKKELGSVTPSPNLAAVLEMAQWRKNYLQWQMHAEKVNEQFMLRNSNPQLSLTSDESHP